MPNFFVPDGSVSDNTVTICGEDAFHIARSLRMAVGERITVCDFTRREYVCVLKTVSDGLVSAEIISSAISPAEPFYHAVLYQALPKGDKMDVIVQKAVECGVSEIIPFLSDRCISRPDGMSLGRKLDRWNKIAREAAMQCGRGIIPKVKAVATLDAIEKESGGGLNLFFYEGDEVAPDRSVIPLPDILRKLPDVPGIIRFIIGGEGGFSSEEAKRITENGYIPAGLGERILRCETAAVFALSCFSYEFELSVKRKQN